MQCSVTVRNTQNDAIEVAVGVSPKLQYFNGAMPANCATADAGTKVAEGTLPSNWLADSASGVKAKAGTWTITGLVTGLARYWRIYDSSGVTCHFQGLCGQAWTALGTFLLNQHAINGGNVYKCTTAGTSAASGGPSGTSTGITDGSCVWDYVGASEMVLTNTYIAATQDVTISTFSLTAGNP